MLKFYLAAKLLLIMLCLVSTAFFTLFERKIMGLGHYRKGPNKVGLGGFLQPFADVVKLVSKNEDFLKIGSFSTFFAMPFGLLLISMIMWNFIYYWGCSSSMKFCILSLIIASSLSIFFLLSMGWVSSSFYSMLGSYRATAQMISYEGVFFILFSVLFWMGSHMNMKNIYYISTFGHTTGVLLIFLFVWTLSVLAETNRTPFDFSEGESELVSGFNTEYSSGLFAMIFLSEYMNILLFFFIGARLVGGFSGLFFTIMSFLLYLVVSMRCCYPRFRYDFLMLWSWKFLMFLVMPMLVLFFFLNNY